MGAEDSRNGARIPAFFQRLEKLTTKTVILARSPGIRELMLRASRPAVGN